MEPPDEKFEGSLGEMYSADIRTFASDNEIIRMFSPNRLAFHEKVMWFLIGGTAGSLSVAIISGVVRWIIGSP